MHFANKSPTAKAESPTEDEEDLEDLTEHVIDHIVSHRRDSKSIMQLRIRWFGFDKSEDTWEPIFHIPAELIRRYVKWKRLDHKEFLSIPLPSLDEMSTVKP